MCLSGCTEQGNFYPTNDRTLHLVEINFLTCAKWICGPYGAFGFTYQFSNLWKLQRNLIGFITCVKNSKIQQSLKWNMPHWDLSLWVISLWVWVCLSELNRFFDALKGVWYMHLKIENMCLKTNVEIPVSEKMCENTCNIV